MRFDIFKNRRRACRGFYIETNGIIRRTVIERKHIIHSMQVPVLWCDDDCELHFWNPLNEREINTIASDLIHHPGFVIRGRVLLVEEEELFYAVRVEADAYVVEDAIRHMVFHEQPIVVDDPIYLRCSMIYTRNPDDALLLGCASELSSIG